MDSLLFQKVLLVIVGLLDKKENEIRIYVEYLQQTQLKVVVVLA